MIRIKVPFALEDYGTLDQIEELPEEIKAWLEKASNINKKFNGNKSISQYHEIIESKKSLWRDKELIEWLLSLSSDKCWYTEVKHGADYPEIEHFRPKKKSVNENGEKVNDGYYWLAFNLTNYRLCKPMPNRKKGSLFPIFDESRRAKNHNNCHLDERPFFLDPLSPRDHLLLSFNDNGKSVPETGITPQQKSRVVFTVKHFGLNHIVLNRRRREVWRACRNLFSNYMRLTLEAERTGSSRIEGKAEDSLEEIIKLIKSSSEFSSVAKAALNKTGESIAQRIAAAVS